MELLIKGEKYILEPDDNINAVMLFGSWARGENDGYSDMDILIVTEKVVQNKYKLYKDNCILNEKWLSVYTKGSLLRLKRYSSLFLWHLKMEGIILYQKDGFLGKLLEQLPVYTKTPDDLEQYQCICNDIEDIITKENCTYEYELALLAAIIRNTCIAYCYGHGKMIFGRNSPIEYVLNKNPLFTLESYQELYRYRSEFQLTKKCNKKIHGSYVKEWLRVANILLEYVRNDYGKK